MSGAVVQWIWSHRTLSIYFSVSSHSRIPAVCSYRPSLSDRAMTFTTGDLPDLCPNCPKSEERGLGITSRGQGAYSRPYYQLLSAGSHCKVISMSRYMGQPMKYTAPLLRALVFSSFVNEDPLTYPTIRSVFRSMRHEHQYSLF